MKKFRVIAVSLNILFAHAVHASSAENTEAFVPEPHVFYLGGGLGYSQLDLDTHNTGFSADNNSATGGKLFVGYAFHETYAIEGYYADLGQVELSPQGSIDYIDFGISGLYHFYSTKTGQKMRAYAKVGLGVMQKDSNLNVINNNDAHLMGGLGFEYDFSHDLSIRVDMDWYTGDASLLSINLIKYFGE